MKKTADDHVDKANLRLRQDNRLSKKESGYRRVRKKTKRLRIKPRDVDNPHRPKT